MKKPLLWGFVLISACGRVWADVTPMDQKQLEHALKASPPCCVIDGRSEANQKKNPLDDVVAYRPDLKVNPTGAIIVLADDDVSAQKIATEIDKRYPGRRVLWVQGGDKTWEAVQIALSRAAASGAPAAGNFSFIIPKNTCESGSPLQKLRSK